MAKGINDWQSGRSTVESCLVEICYPRLRRNGIDPGANREPSHEAELKLYRLLRAEGGNAYGRYNALLRSTVSFCRALEHRNR